ncbi:DUF6531 domain-containing protein, partial [Endozoicomonas acroporae]
PVIVSTGRFQWNETDVALAGYGNIQIARTFNSQEPRSGIFGNGWTVSCEISLLKTVDQIETDAGVEAQEQYVLRTGSGKRYTW